MSNGSTSELWRERLLESERDSARIERDEAEREADRIRSDLSRLSRELEAMTVERDELQRAADRVRRHPMAPERCPECSWTNVNLMNYGMSGEPKWMCHGCATFALSSVAELKRELGRVMPVYLAAVKLYELDEADAMAGEGLSPRFPGTFAALSALYEAIDSTPKPGDS
jgi:transposase-like protein